MTIHLATDCPGCSGCVVQRQLNERETFNRSEVAYLLALAFRSGASLALEMSEDIVRWAGEPIVKRTAEQRYRERLAAIEAGAERQRAIDAARPPRPIPARGATGVDEAGNVVRVGEMPDPDVEWPAVVEPGTAEAP